MNMLAAAATAIPNTKKIFINYCCPPIWNSALNFLFWLMLGITSAMFFYLFLMFTMDTTIKADAASASPGAVVGNPTVYADVVQQYLKTIWLIGPILYP